MVFKPTNQPCEIQQKIRDNVIHSVEWLAVASFRRTAFARSQSTALFHPNFGLQSTTAKDALSQSIRWQSRLYLADDVTQGLQSKGVDIDRGFQQQP